MTYDEDDLLAEAHELVATQSSSESALLAAAAIALVDIAQSLRVLTNPELRQ